MLVKLSLIDLYNAIRERLEGNTEYTVYDVIPEGKQSPLLYLEVVGKEDISNKMMYRERYEVWVHCIASPSNSRAEVNKMIVAVEEALTDAIEFPEHFQLLQQYENGTMAINQDETDEWHAVLSFSFDVVYGFKVKI